MFSKKHILDEIRRTAKENGGIPLGRQKFVKETGIKPYDYEKFWSRLGDAQREAGFSPNELQGAYDEEFLIQSYIELTRDIGRLPTRADLRVKRHSNDSFPSPNTFETRLGNKKKLIRNVLAYCEQHSTYDDIVELCRVALDEMPTQSTTVHRQQADEAIGYVYLMKSGRHYKIGKTNSVGRREREIAIQMPEKLTAVHSIKTDDPTGIEAYWHKRFEAKRKQGEWFELNADEVQAFKRRKFM